jgi:hypothetical protein
MYSITSDLVEKKVPKYLGAGVHEVKLTKVEFKYSPTGKPIFAYTYANDKGQECVKTEWAINFPDNYESLPEPKKRGYEIAKRNQMTRILRVATLFVPISEFDGRVFKDTPEKSAFESFAEFVANKLKGKHENIPLRIKAAYDKNGWITTPSYTYDDNEWVERADKVSKEESSIAMTSADAVVRPAPKAEGYRKPSSLVDDTDKANSTVESVPKVKEDLPF